MAEANSSRRPHLLLGVTGSVATIKIYNLVDALKPFCEVRVICTENSRHFFDMAKLRDSVTVFTDQDEYAVWQKRGDPVLHIQLREWADVFLVAPLSANSLASVANGICNNLLTCVFRAWDYKDEKKRIIVAPAMNTQMWENPFTARHISLLEGIPFNIKFIDTVEKLLMCDIYGNGAMAEVATITETTKAIIHDLGLLRRD